MAPRRLGLLRIAEVSKWPSLSEANYSRYFSATSASPVSNASTTSPSLQSAPFSSPSVPQSSNPSTPWQLPGPPPSAPPLSQVIFASYNPSLYGPMPGARQSPVNLGFYQGGVPLSTSDSSRGGVSYNRPATTSGTQGPKPPLPVRIFSRYCSLKELTSAVLAAAKTN